LLIESMPHEGYCPPLRVFAVEADALASAKAYAETAARWPVDEVAVYRVPAGAAEGEAEEVAVFAVKGRR
jgi:hypothetical protein